MPQGLICCSHSPLMLGAMAPRDADAEKEVRASFRRAADWVRKFNPELIVVFGPDHYNGFFYDLMPPFTIGVRASGTIDWGLEPGPLNVPEGIALDCLHAVRDAGVDIAFSYKMTADHGITIPLHYLTTGLNTYPVLPIVVDCVAPPMPSFKRTRLLGEAVGSYFSRRDERVLFIGSGGLSHDPPTPRLNEGPLERYDWLITRHDGQKQTHDRRQARVVQAAQKLLEGKGSCLPPDEEWDRNFLEILQRRDLTAFDAWNDETVSRVGGHGAHEVRCWIAGFAAMQAKGDFEATLECYRCIPEWLTGMAVMTGYRA